MVIKSVRLFVLLLISFFFVSCAESEQKRNDVLESESSPSGVQNYRPSQTEPTPYKPYSDPEAGSRDTSHPNYDPSVDP